MKKPTFLEPTDVIYIHTNQIEEYGGEAGIRDLNLLLSAISQPKQSFGDQYLHENLFSMAAAYLFHICKNHPFIDGNKRTALASALVFLEINGISIKHSTKLYDLTIKTASENITKAEIETKLQKLAR